MIDGWMNKKEMRIQLGLDPNGDYRTLDKYAEKGTLEVKPISRMVKLYRIKADFVLPNNNKIDLDFCN